MVTDYFDSSGYDELRSGCDNQARSVLCNPGAIRGTVDRVYAVGVVVRIGRLQTPGGWPSGNRTSPKFGLHEQVINHLNWEVPHPATDATRWRSSAPCGGVWAPGWLDVGPASLGAPSGPLNATAVSGPTAEIPQSPKRGPVSRLSAKLARYCHIHLGVSNMAGSERGFGSKGCRRWVPQCAADCISEQIMRPRQPRRNRAEVLPKPFEHVLNGRTGCRSGFVGFVGSTLAFAARMQDDDPARWMHGIVQG